MAVLARLNVRVNRQPPASQTPHAQLGLDVSILPASQPASELRATVAIAAGAADVLPTQNYTAGVRVEQVVVFKLLVGGQEVKYLTGSWSVDHTSEGTSWELSLPAAEVRDAIGWEIDHAGAPAGGLLTWSIVAEYGTDQLAYYLLQDGVAENSNRTVTREGGHLLRANGFGPEGCFDRALVDYQQPAHHGLTPGEVIRDLLAAIGVPAGKIAVGSAIGSARANAINLAQVSGWQEARLVADSQNRLLLWEDGQVIAPLLLPETPPQIVITLNDIIAVNGLGDVDTTSEKPACIIVEGTRSERSTERDGISTTTQTITVVAPKAVERAYFSQNSGSSTLNPVTNGGPQPEKDLVVSKTITRTVREDGCVSLRTTEVYGWHKLEALRYVLDSTTTDLQIGLAGYLSCQIYESAAVADDASAAYHYQQEKFERLTYEEVRFGRDDDGRLTTKTTRRGRWKLLSAAYKNRASAGVSWETLNVLSGIKARADLTAVVGFGPSDQALFFGPPPSPSVTSYGWQLSDPTLDTGQGAAVDTERKLYSHWAEKVTETLDNTDDNFKKREEAESEGYRIPPGALYLFPGDVAGGGLQEWGLFTGSKTTDYQTTGPASHRTIDAEFDGDGKLLKQTVTEDKEGWPASDICTEESLDAAESVGFRGEACVDLISFKPFTAYESNPYLENEDEAAAYARRRLVEEHTIRLTFALPVAASLRRRMPMTVNFSDANLPDYGWAGDGVVEDVRHTSNATDAGQETHTEITFLLKVIE